jgi:hypothetical protein
LRNYVTPQNYNPDIIFTTGADYDTLVIFNKATEPILCDKKNVYGFIMEPSWSNFWDRNLGSYCHKVYFHDLSLIDIPNKESFIEFPSLMLYHMDQVPIDYFLNKTFKKNKPISYVVRNLSTKDNNRLAWKRVELVKEILKSNLPIDIFGPGWDSEMDTRIKGPIQNKESGLSEYEYSIAIENCPEKNYISEKFYDCLLCDSIPIYYGAQNIKEIFEDSFINLDLFGDPISQLGRIITTKNYKPPTSLKQEYFNKYNIYNILSQNFKSNI